MSTVLSARISFSRKLFFYVVIALIILFINLYIIRLAFVYGPSMKPAIKHMSAVLVLCFLCAPQNGDIVVFDSRTPFGISAVKRVIATGGQNVRIENSMVYLDNELLLENYLFETEWRSPSINIDVPEGSVFVMGDNRRESKDSRDFGCISVERIIGKVLWVVRDGTD
jgi:signal peptidase I